MPAHSYRKFLRFVAICGDGIMFWMSICIMSLLAIMMMSMYNNVQETVANIEAQVVEIPITIQEELEKTRLLYRHDEINRELLVRQQLDEIRRRYAVKRMDSAKAVTKEQEDRKDRSFFGRVKKILLF